MPSIRFEGIWSSLGGCFTEHAYISVAVNIVRTYWTDSLKPSEYTNVINSYKLTVYLRFIKPNGDNL